MNLASESICYFKNFHHALRENPRIDVIIKTPSSSCTVLRVKFFADKKRVALALSGGIIAIISISEQLVLKLLFGKHAVID